jgi:hypothetical protein
VRVTVSRGGRYRAGAGTTRAGRAESGSGSGPTLVGTWTNPDTLAVVEGRRQEGQEAGPGETSSPRRMGRRIAFAVAAAIFAAGAFGGLLGLGLVIGWFDDTDGGIHRVHDIGFGVLYGVILTSACLAMIRRPERKASAFFQILVTVVAGLIAALTSADGRCVFFPVIVAASAAILLAIHPARAELFRPALRPSGVLAALAVAGSVPLVWFGLTMARLQRTGLPVDPHVKNDHWANMAAMAFALVLLGLLASARMWGWRLTAWCAGLGAAVFGLASIVFHRFPGTNLPYPGSKGIGWGLAAMVGGLAFVGVAEWEARRRQLAG